MHQRNNHQLSNSRSRHSRGVLGHELHQERRAQPATQPALDVSVRIFTTGRVRGRTYSVAMFPYSRAIQKWGAEKKRYKAT
jgi:hypothetical protein